MMKPCQKKKAGGNTKNKMEGPKSKKTKEPPTKGNHPRNIKFPNPPCVTRSILNKEKGKNHIFILKKEEKKEKKLLLVPTISPLLIITYYY